MFYEFFKKNYLRLLLLRLHKQHTKITTIKSAAPAGTAIMIIVFVSKSLLPLDGSSDRLKGANVVGDVAMVVIGLNVEVFDWLFTGVLSAKKRHCL